jgi:ATP-dependent Clp protease adaptor protein ClpS
MAIMPDDTPNKPELQAAPDPSPGALAEVRILNDDVTPMHFVVDMVQQVFGKDFETAERIMLETHHEGAGVCGIYPYDIAEAKVTAVLKAAREHHYPLQCVLERGSSAARDQPE